ncbi:small integral membrane protein 14 isoform X1 [Temnothorax longispinosus]
MRFHSKEFRPSDDARITARQDSARGLPPATMSDEGFDPCECMWNYMSVQHLLSILRQSQDYCSDTECFSISRLPGPQTNVRESSDFLFTCLMIGFMVLLYAFRPSLRRSTRNIIKSSNEPGSHEDGPPSPPTMN